MFAVDAVGNQQTPSLPNPLGIIAGNVVQNWISYQFPHQIGLQIFMIREKDQKNPPKL
jgi:hypothetical protein